MTDHTEQLSMLPTDPDELTTVHTDEPFDGEGDREEATTLDTVEDTVPDESDVDATADDAQDGCPTDASADDVRDELTCDIATDGTTDEAFVQEPMRAGATDAAVTVERQSRTEAAFELFEMLAVALATVLLLLIFLFRHSVVSGASMESTLQDGDHLIISSFLYTPEVGDIVVFQDYDIRHKSPLVKRIIATEGQTVYIESDTVVYVDGVRIEGGFVDGSSVDYAYPITCTVSEGHVFVLGDHRNDSSDSRRFGEIPVESILGKVLLRIWPPASFGVPGALPD